MNRLGEFISRLDSLIVFLAAAHEEVFQTIRRHGETWFPESQDPKLPDTFESYRVAVGNAAFLLGYAYFETFLADLAREVYLHRPEMLPKEKQVTFKEVLGPDTREGIVRLLIEKEIRSVFYGAIETVSSYFRQRLQVPWPDQPELIVASRLRNCLMHNGGVVDDRLAEVWHRSVGSSIRLEPSEVHEFGLMARGFARMVWEEAERRHLQRAG